MFKLPNTIQCAQCPWRKDVNPLDIPNGYCVGRHKALEDTIAKVSTYDGLNPELVGDFDSSLKMMACHESENGHEYPCIGWLNHQIGVGNNIKLRLHMLHCSNLHEVVLCGEQHENFADTVPDDSETALFKDYRPSITDLCPNVTPDEKENFEIFKYYDSKDYDPSEHDYYF